MGDNEELIQRIKEIKWFHSIPTVSYTHLTLPTKA